MCIRDRDYGTDRHAQTWKEIQLPEKFEKILFAGDPIVTGQLARWGLRSVIDSGDQRYEHWACYRSTDAGTSRLLTDTGHILCAC